MATDYTITIKQYARQLGFDACGIADTSPIDPQHHCRKWVESGFNADMDWFRKTLSIREDISKRLPGVQSVVVVARNYYSNVSPVFPDYLRIARYAWGEDYHPVLRHHLKDLAAFITSLGNNVATYISVDTGPVLEKAWAVRAGLGWRGKNSLVLNPDLGSWFFIGVIATTLPLTPDSPMESRCGDCEKCIRACPTGAIVSPHTVDSRRCIAYHTVENKGVIPTEVCAKLSGWLFGCDICQEVCPWNHNRRETTEPRLKPLRSITCITPSELLSMTEKQFREKFSHSSLCRAGLEKLKRTVLDVVQRYQFNLTDTVIKTDEEVPKEPP